MKITALGKTSDGMFLLAQRAAKFKTPPGEPSGVLILAMSYSRAAYRRTTSGAAAFHFRVRNGNGWDHCAIITRVRNRTGNSLLSQRREREAESLGTFVNPLYQNFERTGSSIGNRKSKIFTSSLASTYRKKKCDSRFIITIHELNELRFV